MVVNERERLMVVSLSNRKRIKRRKAPPTKKLTTTGPNKRMLAPVRQRRGRYADTTTGRMSNGDGGMALLHAVRSQGKLEALHDQSKKTIGNLEMRLGKAEANLRHKLDGHSAERDGDIGMSIPPTVPLNGDGASSAPVPTAPAKPDTEMKGPVPMATPSPMGGTSAPNPGAKQQPAPRVARRTKSSMDVDSTSPSDFIQKRPSTSSLVQPTSSRARVDGGNGQLALSVAARAKPDRGRDDDEVLGKKKLRSQGFGTAQVSAITESGKKMRAQPGVVVADPLALPPSATGIDPPPVQLSRKQHATTASQFALITNSEATDDDI